MDNSRKTVIIREEIPGTDPYQLSLTEDQIKLLEWLCEHDLLTYVTFTITESAPIII